jgi:hypothetical protein
MNPRGAIQRVEPDHGSGLTPQIQVCLSSLYSSINVLVFIVGNVISIHASEAANAELDSN